MSNPFAILSLDRAATKREILTQVAKALREGRHDARVIAEAQKILFDPIARAAAEFEYCLDACSVPASLSSEPTGDGERPVLERLC
jgi:hypothetical protein